MILDFYPERSVGDWSSDVCSSDLGVPGREELAMGVIASNGVIVINDDVVRGLGIAPETIHRVSDEEGY